jgi:dolichol-phosphate mannosyltransferase
VFQIEVTYRALMAGFRVVEVPIVFRDRTRGASKMSTRIALEAMLAVPTLRRQASPTPARPGPSGDSAARGEQIRDRVP